MQAYADALKAAGQRVAYVQVPGAGQRILGLEARLTVTAMFTKYGVSYAAKMKAFFDPISYPEAKPSGTVVGGVDASKLAASQRPSE